MPLRIAKLIADLYYLNSVYCNTIKAPYKIENCAAITMVDRIPPFHKVSSFRRQSKYSNSKMLPKIIKCGLLLQME